MNCTTLPKYYKKNSGEISSYCDIIHAKMSQKNRDKSFSYKQCLVKGTELQFKIDRIRSGEQAILIAVGSFVLNLIIIIVVSSSGSNRSL